MRNRLLATKDGRLAAILNSDPFSNVQDRLCELETERRTKLDALATLEATQTARAVPVDLADAPAENLRALFETFRLVIRYHKADHHALVQVTLADDTIKPPGHQTSSPLHQRKRPATTIIVRHRRVRICVAPPTGFEPVLPP